jgi:ABC-2 type transport system permease protein
MFALLFSLGLTLHLQISPELMQQAQHEFAGTAQMYIKELWNLPCDHPHLFSFILLRLLLYSSFYAAIGAAVIIKPTRNNFFYP